MHELTTDISLIGKLKDGLASFAFYGMTQQMAVDTKAVITMLIVGGLSAFGGAYINAERTAVELKQYARAQEEFRAEMRQYMREATVEVRSLSDRITRQEIMSSSYHSGQNGMNGGKK